MQYYLQNVSYITGQESVVRNYGDFIWEGICNSVRLGQRIIVKDLVYKIPEIKDLAVRTQLDYIRVVLHNIVAEYESSETPEDCPIERISARFWRMAP